mmetsp:Transcript_14336/g.34608  ORF Transcript_14336/g.34608 Transcript_14336/m.34608 type:complete len:214 (-) Transcript_14336:18-659(-)
MYPYHPLHGGDGDRRCILSSIFGGFGRLSFDGIVVRLGDHRLRNFHALSAPSVECPAVIGALKVFSIGIAAIRDPSLGKRHLLVGTAIDHGIKYLLAANHSFCQNIINVEEGDPDGLVDRHVPGPRYRIPVRGVVEGIERLLLFLFRGGGRERHVVVIVRRRHGGRRRRESRSRPRVRRPPRFVATGYGGMRCGLEYECIAREEERCQVGGCC